MKLYLLRLFVCAALLVSPAIPLLPAQTAPDKLALMSDALRARSSGDFATAKAKLEELLAFNPMDPNIQRLLASVNAEIARAARGEQPMFAAPTPEPVPKVPVPPARALPPAPEAPPQVAVETLVRKGKAQFIAGELEAAQATFAQVEAQDPGNEAAADFFTRLAAVRPRREANARAQTRAELLEEVAQSWQRPQVFDRTRARPPVAEDDGLREKLAGITIPRVSFNGIPLSRVVDTLAALSEEYDPQRAGANIVLIDPGGNDPAVTITLRRLSLARILDFVTEAVGYEYDVQRDAVVVRQGQGGGTRLETDFFPITRSTIIRLTGVGSDGVEASRPFTDPFAPPALASTISVGSGVTEEEDALKNFLQRAGVPFSTVEGANLALADGQLIVTQTPRHLEKVRNILRRYSEVKQVEIEARFLEVQQGDLEELGFQWGVQVGGDRYRGEGRSLGRAFSVSSSESTLSINRPEDVGGNLDLGQGAPRLPTTIDLADDAGDLANITGVIGNAEVSLLIRALERKSGSDLMSAPKVTVLSGKTAEIVVAQEMRYPESFGDIEAQVGRGDSSGSGSAGVAITAGTPQDFVTRNIGVEMEVTPSVEDDNAISLLLEPRVTEFEGFVEYGGQSFAIASNTTVTVPSGFFQPIFSVRRVRTEVTIWDGATVVLGGLTREQAVMVHDRVPVLGDLPLVGRAFRSEGESSEKRNLLIFVSANLISPGGSPARQGFQAVAPGALFQNPTIVTPQGAVSRGGN